jgi:hypothetical protein
MDRTVMVLKQKVRTAIPAERGYRAAAVALIDSLEKATKIFEAPTND